jgi:hypothetical protein
VIVLGQLNTHLLALPLAPIVDLDRLFDHRLVGAAQSDVAKSA